ncbi:MAG: hypothetical protein F6J87_15875 [Spirulina sp. SIO3F2]|nr:hypothetical protein [Spirulina sp. SIO3F2]
MRWPVWFPYPRAFAHCLLMLVLVSVSLSLTTPIVWALMLFIGGASVLTEALTKDPSIWGLVILLAVPLLAFVDLLFLAWFYQAADSTFRFMGKKNKPKFRSIPPWKHWRDALFANITFALGMGAATFSWLLILCKAGECHRQELTDGEVWLIAIAAIVMMLYCYHVRMLRLDFYERRRKRRNIKRNQTQLPKVKRPSKSPKSQQSKQSGAMAEQQLTVDEELEQLKRQVERDKKNKS